ncbi:MAG: hypothetical protein HETSPECPRED_008552 [Heterodermia speciosa]|uniref:Uncharacterized protein n=1 Tax=Heterodermia speciosa TaxID=116794 RepID=A0A8H3G233_9LECA|nr:MAG: hypothetical protein HETSPECPRED_008552 [Heterodermia speciosa]
MAMTPTGELNRTEVRDLLSYVAWRAKQTPKEAIIGTTLLRDPDTKDGPGFLVAPPLYLRVFTWRDVFYMAGSLLDYYHKEHEHGPWPQLAFLTHDSKRGALGSGVLRSMQKLAVDLAEGDVS